ncbi:hypothetical protein P171DRAFT_435498 [Karstenula rhodostoma CBS 690.94]|uniref:Uncharacterized protein n=1 Tax=Karstenula rhodostoma CBS 690.94 TaxID=1392251 RepID=A0A9P4PCV2_9PLEO|nr:hypothetical protein P171DRAFT_435498 [Karstenula rhodostoma CBS 690.94]
MAANAPYFKDHLTPANVALAPEPGDHVRSRSASTKDDDVYTSCQISELPAGALQENHNFVELLEAATTTAEKARSLAGHDTARAMTTQKGKRKRSLQSPGICEDDTTSGFKHARVQTTPHIARSNLPQVDPGLEKPTHDTAPSATDSPGIHSAAALFRRPSERNPRKHTRLSMSKLFMSLQLSPESFLHLQSEAKSYMLDPAHPERQSCVGNRGKGDTDMVKLRLFNCVREFLDGGAGERFFGETSASKRQRERDPREAARALGEDEVHADNDLIWPGDGNKLVSLVTPLLRRMVTNERQRIYAIETRKAGSRGKEGSLEAIEKAVPARQQVPTSFTKLPPSPKGSNTTNTGVTSSLPFSYSIVDLLSSDHSASPQNISQAPHIEHLNVFLKREMRIIGSVRFHHTADAPLVSLSWPELLNCIGHLMGQCNRTTQDPLLDIGPDTLRGLAVAANNVQASDPSNEGTSLETSSRPSNVVAYAPDRPISGTDNSQRACATPMPEATSRTIRPELIHVDARLPQERHSEGVHPYRLEAMRSAGRVVIKNESDWEALKLDIAFADWADHTLNVVATLSSAHESEHSVLQSEEQSSIQTFNLTL